MLTAAEKQVKGLSIDLKSTGNLLHTLAPGADCFGLYDRRQRRIPLGDDSESSAIDQYMQQLPSGVIQLDSNNTDRIVTQVGTGQTLLLLPLVNGSESIGIFAAAFPADTSQDESSVIDACCESVQDLSEQLVETVRLYHQVEQAEYRARSAERELQLLYKVDDVVYSNSQNESLLAELVEQSSRFLSVCYSVLLLPAKHIRVSATHASWKSFDRKAIDQFLLKTALPKLQEKGAPAVFSMPVIDGIDIPQQDIFQVLLCPLSDQNGEVEGFVGHLCRVDGKRFTPNDVRFATHVTHRMHYLLSHSFDPLTGLLNRKGFEMQLREVTSDLTARDRAHQVIHMNIDKLQLVNDTFGRAAGDIVLTRFARALEQKLPAGSIFARLTGDDFVVVVPDGTIEKAIQLGSVLRETCHELRYLQGENSLQITFSGGIAEMNAQQSPGSALTAARMASVAAEDHGRDRIEVHDQEDQSMIQRYDDMQLIAEIQKALDTDSFILFAQPIEEFESLMPGQYHEVLLRMIDSEGQRVSSSAFISSAERYQMMPQVDRWVVQKTLQQLVPHIESLAMLNATFAINLSGQSLGDDETLAFIHQEIEASGIPPEMLCFEITESAAIASLKKAQAFIASLRDKGCLFALDDFGAGLSSFAYLKSLEVETLKIDGSFIRDIVNSKISESMVVAITQVAKVMNLRTVAEFVETEEAKTLLRRIGVDYVQGHVIGKPRPLSDVLSQSQAGL